MIFENKTSFTSETFVNTKSLITEKYLVIDGPGPVAIEQQGEDGVWRATSELTFSGSQTVIVSIKAGPWRVAITGGPTTVEID